MGAGGVLARSPCLNPGTCGPPGRSAVSTGAGHCERAIERVLQIFRGRGSACDTTGDSPGSKWTALNAIAEHLDYGRWYTTRTNQMQRSFEDTSLKQRALELVAAA